MRSLRAVYPTRMPSILSVIRVRLSALSGQFITNFLSVVALILSGFTFWYTSIRAPDLEVATTNLIYSAHDSGTKYEFIMIPLTVLNRGGGTGTLRYFNLKITYLDAPTTNFPNTKEFDSENFISQNGSSTQFSGPFEPISVTAGTSDSRFVAFYPLIRDTNFIIYLPGRYEIALTGVSDGDDQVGNPRSALRMVLAHLGLKSPGPRVNSTYYFDIPKSEEIQNQLSHGGELAIRTVTSLDIVNNSSVFIH